MRMWVTEGVGLFLLLPFWASAFPLSSHMEYHRDRVLISLFPTLIHFNQINFMTTCLWFSSFFFFMLFHSLDSSMICFTFASVTQDRMPFTCFTDVVLTLVFWIAGVEILLLRGLILNGTYCKFVSPPFPPSILYRHQISALVIWL